MAESDEQPDDHHGLEQHPSLTEVARGKDLLRYALADPNYDPSTDPGNSGSQRGVHPWEGDDASAGRAARQRPLE